MNRAIVTTFSLLPTILIISFLLPSAESSDAPLAAKIVEQKKADKMENVIPLADIFYSESSFFSVIKKVENESSVDGIRSIVIPHHLVASDIIADLIKKSSGVKRKRVFVIGPNHYNTGVSPVASTLATWETPFGELENDTKSTSDLLSFLAVGDEENIFYNEHSIGGLAPFVKYYFPDSLFVPIAINSYADFRDIDMLNNWLHLNAKEDDLIIFSIDFSHYLTKNQAEEKDTETKGLILENNLDKISRLGNENVDAPMILVLALMHAEKNKLKVNIINHANSFDYSSNKPQSTTSYFGIIFSKL